MILKYISTLFNKIINSNITIYIILGVIIYLLYTSNVKLRNDVSRLENNQIALTTEYSRQIEVSKSTFKQLFHKEDSIANLINIKTKTIKNVVVNNYHYKDTTIVSFPLTKKDSINTDTLQFTANMGCMMVDGEVIKSTNTINIKDKDYRDVLYTYLYEAYDSRFLGFLWKIGKHIDAKTYSECMQDTVSIERNIKIIK